MSALPTIDVAITVHHRSDVVGGVPWSVVRTEAMRVKRRHLPAYEAEDFVQDVALRLLSWAKWNPSRGGRRVFVRVVARSCLRDWARRGGRRAPLAVEDITSLADALGVTAWRGRSVVYQSVSVTNYGRNSAECETYRPPGGLMASAFARANPKNESDTR